MKRPLATLIGFFAVSLSILYLMTARVYVEGSSGESYLMLKPFPSFAFELGGGEEGAWARANPATPPPWWQSQKAVKLAWGGDWEDPKLWTSFYTFGYFITPLLWFAFATLFMWPKTRKK